MKKFTEFDFAKPVSIGNVTFSPDEKSVVFTTLKTDLNNQNYYSDLWLLDPADNSLSRLTEDGCVGSFSFLNNEELIISQNTELGNEVSGTRFLGFSIKGKKTRVLFTLPLPGLSAVPLTEEYFLISGYQSRPDTSQQKLDLSIFSEEFCQYLQQHPYETIEESPYRADGVGNVHGLRHRIWIYSIITKELTSITTDTFQCSLTYWHKESQTLFFTGESYTSMPSHRDSLYAIPLKEIDHANAVPIFNVDGSISSITATNHKLFLLVSDARENQSILSISFNGASPSLELSLEGNAGWCLDTDIALLGGECFQASEGKIWMIYSDPTGARISTYHNGKITPISPIGQQVRSFTRSSSGIILAVCIKDFWPLELCRLDNGQFYAITSFNQELSSTSLNHPSSLSFKNRAGMTMTGWILPPYNNEQGKKYPGFLMIHEGPQGRYEGIYHSDMQYIASLGYFVFFTNPRGGTCVTREFADIEDKMGSIDYEDLMDFTDAVLEQYPQIDQSKLVVGGISYGGYMTNWIIGHTNRFRSAISMSSISNWTSEYAASDFPYCVEYGCVSGKPWTNFNNYWKSSPISSAQNAVTPTLFIQGEADYRCPLGQAEQMFCVLQKNHIHSRLIEFHEASHNFGYYGLPTQRAERYLEIKKWLDETIQNKI